jgi:hypothetical protein
MGRFVLAVLFLIFAGLGIAGWIFRAEAMLAVALISAHAPDGPFDAAKAPPAMTGMVLRGDVKRGLSDAQGTIKNNKARHGRSHGSANRPPRDRGHRRR